MGRCDGGKEVPGALQPMWAVLPVPGGGQQALQRLHDVLLGSRGVTGQPRPWGECPLPWVERCLLASVSAPGSGTTKPPWGSPASALLQQKCWGVMGRAVLGRGWFQGEVPDRLGAWSVGDACS